MIRQTVIPKPGNRYYNQPTNPCIVGNIPKGEQKQAKRTGYKGLNVLPNCVGYAVGRFNEIALETGCTYIRNCSPAGFIPMAKKQGLEVGSDPKLGGIMVWLKKDGSGHVAIVEEVFSASKVFTSESEWNGIPFVNYTRTIGEGNWRSGCYWMGVNYIYQGCIYQPKEVHLIKDLKIIYNGAVVSLKAVSEAGENYIRLRDINDILNLAEVSYNSSKKMPEVKNK